MVVTINNGSNTNNTAVMLMLGTPKTQSRNTSRNASYISKKIFVIFTILVRYNFRSTSSLVWNQSI